MTGTTTSDGECRSTSDPFSCFGSDDDDSDSDNVADDAAAAAINIAAERNQGACSSAERARRLVAAANARQRNASIEHLPLSSPDDYELFEDPTGTRGMGLRARRAYACGDEIMREGAAMRVRNTQAASSVEEAETMRAISVQTAFDALTAATQEAVMGLSSCERCLVADGGLVTPLGVYETNNFQLANESEGGLFLTIARINHSCRPNCNHVWRPDLQMTLVFASRDIEIGEEICTTYGPSECLDTAGRRSYLREAYSFECTCEMCIEGNSMCGDDRMVELNALHENISLLASTGKPAAAIRNVDRCLALLDEQGIGTGAFVKPILHHGYQISLMGSQDRVMARSYLARELIAVNNSEGVGCYKATDIQRMLDDMDNAGTNVVQDDTYSGQ